MRSVLLNPLQNIGLGASVDLLNVLDPRRNFGPLFDLQSRIEPGLHALYRKGAVSLLVDAITPNRQLLTDRMGEMYTVPGIGFS